MALDFAGLEAVVAGPEGQFVEAISHRLIAQGAGVKRVSDEASMTEWATDDAASVDILILTIDRPSEATLLALDKVEAQSIIEAQLLHLIQLTQSALKRMRSANFGRIVVCIPSKSVFGADQGIGATIAGAALASLAKSIALGNLDRDIRSNVVSYVAQTPASQSLFDEHPVLNPDLFAVESILPAITYLAHSSCALNGETISAGAGRFAKLYTSVTLGALDPSIDDECFCDLLPKLSDTRFTFSPRSVIDELITISV